MMIQPGPRPVTPTTSGSSRIAPSSCHTSSATRFIAARARSMSALEAICTSSSARDQCWVMLPTRWICPLATCHTVPSAERIRVARKLTASTVPLASPTSTTSGQHILDHGLGTEPEGDPQ
jgi:hypothetical protein